MLCTCTFGGESLVTQTQRRQSRPALTAQSPERYRREAPTACKRRWTRSAPGTCGAWLSFVTVPHLSGLHHLEIIHRARSEKAHCTSPIRRCSSVGSLQSRKCCPPRPAAPNRPIRGPTPMTADDRATYPPTPQEDQPPERSRETGLPIPLVGIRSPSARREFRLFQTHTRCQAPLSYGLCLTANR